MHRGNLNIKHVVLHFVLGASGEFNKFETHASIDHI